MGPSQKTPTATARTRVRFYREKWFVSTVLNFLNSHRFGELLLPNHLQASVPSGATRLISGRRRTADPVGL
jgi:hypothetical protein